MTGPKNLHNIMLKHFRTNDFNKHTLKKYMEYLNDKHHVDVDIDRELVEAVYIDLIKKYTKEV